MKWKDDNQVILDGVLPTGGQDNCGRPVGVTVPVRLVLGDHVVAGAIENEGQSQAVRLQLGTLLETLVTKR